MPTTGATRLWVLLARAAPRAVVFRRGPSKQVQLILWNTDADTFTPGQWLKGRIYERRADLSPSGQRLIYFAAKFKDPYYSWTAVSRPPYLTALALWPKSDTVGGGGLFASEDEILLDHSGADFNLAPGYVLPEAIRVGYLGMEAGDGGDLAEVSRLVRDGWVRLQEGKSVSQGHGAPLSFNYNPPEIWSHAHPAGRPWELRRVILGYGERGGAWDVTEHAISSTEDQQAVHLGRTDWADWDRTGELLFAKDGGLFRLGFDAHGSLRPPEDATRLIDTRPFVFAEMQSPPEAKDWWSHFN
jgi:hypothetical protein